MRIQLLRPAPGHVSTTFAEHAARAVVYLFCGIDFGWSTSADWRVTAATSGRVIFAGYSGKDYGNLVVIDHGNGITTWYAHLDSFTVTVGQMVVAGQHLGVMGSSGNAKGRHLHFELRINGVQVDPEPYFVNSILDLEKAMYAVRNKRGSIWLISGGSVVVPMNGAQWAAVGKAFPGLPLVQFDTDADADKFVASFAGSTSVTQFTLVPSGQIDLVAK
ncbi:MAG TPA: M23 family metallopeptidase [Microbacteriaceae bacterium]|nr:M23 family metallopeptidase [Microbacteriaceae bacterium]